MPMNVNYLDSIEAGDGLWVLANGGKYGEGCEVQTTPSVIKPQKTLFPIHTAGGFANAEAFAALKKDGSVVTWGSSGAGGVSSYVSKKLKNIKAIYPTYSSNGE